MYTLIKRISETNTNLIELGIIAKRNAEVEGGEVNKEIQYHIIKATNHITKALSKAIDPRETTSINTESEKKSKQRVKECPKCNAIKTEAEFYKDKSSKDGLSHWCKKCHDYSLKKIREKEKIEASSKQGGKAWTKEEEAYLWANRSKNTKQLSKELGRSRTAIQTRLRILRRVAETKANII